MRRSAAKARSRPSGAGSPPRVRRASSRPIGLASRRRATKLNTAADEASIHWMSSTATSSGPFTASARRAPSAARATTCWSGVASAASASSRAAASARAWGAGSPSRAAGRASSRSLRAAYDQVVSASAGRAPRVLTPASRAATSAASQIAVLPAPASPSITIARPPRGSSATKLPTRFISSSRPTSSALMVGREPTPIGVPRQRPQGVPRSARHSPLRTPAMAARAGW